MPYRHETCRAGKTKQHTFYYAARSDTKEGSRRKKENKTSEAQKKVNSRQSEKKLTWVINENFDGTSLYVTYSYAKEKRPAGKEELRADIEKLLRDMRREYKAVGDVLKYVWVAEVGERGAVHIHMVLNAIEIARLKKRWDKGWIDIKPLDDSGQYRKLASYFVKYSEKTMKTCEGFSGKRYNSSKNLKIPQPTKTTVRSKNAYNHTIEIPKGWYLDKDSVAEAWHEVTGFMYFTYTLIYDGINQRQAKEDYILNLETGEVEITEKPRREKRTDMLVLPIKKKWFDMILSGEKKEEYREIKPYYKSRFEHCFNVIKYHDKYINAFEENPEREILFRNGYSKDSPSFIAKCTLSVGTGREEWGAETGKEYFILSIKEIKKCTEI